MSHSHDLAYEGLVRGSSKVENFLQKNRCCRRIHLKYHNWVEGDEKPIITQFQDHLLDSYILTCVESLIQFPGPFSLIGVSILHDKYSRASMSDYVAT